MDNEDQEIKELLDKIRDRWQAEKRQIEQQPPLFSEEELLRIIHSPRKSIYIHDRRIRIKVFIGLLILFIGIILGIIHLWNIHAIGWFIVLGCFGLINLWFLIEVIDELYWHYQIRPYSLNDNLIEKGLDHLEHNRDRRLQLWRFFIHPNQINYSIRWGRVIGTSLSMAILIGVLVITIPTTDSITPTTITPNSIPMQANVIDSLPLKIDNTKPIPITTPQQQLAQIANTKTIKNTSPKENIIEASATNTINDNNTSIKKEEPLYMNIESHYNTIIKVRCNKSCVAENITNTCDELLLDIN